MCLLIIILLAGSACHPEASLSTPSTPVQPSTTPTSTPAAAKTILSPTPSQSAAPNISDQFAQMVQMAQARYERELKGDALREAEESLSRWQDMAWAEIEYAMKNGEDGNQVLQRYLADLDLRTQVNLKWAAYQERTPEQQKAALAAVEQYAGLEAAYQNSGLWPFNWMVMAETYRAGRYVYRVDVETDRIIEIEPVNDASIPTSGSYGDPETGREKARAVIARLAPDVDLAALALSNNVSPGYYVWEDRTAPRLQDGQYPRVQVEYGPDGTFVNFINTLAVASR